jgi:hypothetical protein
MGESEAVARRSATRKHEKRKHEKDDLISKDNPLQTIGQHSHVEVDAEPDRQLGYPEVTHDLATMDRRKLFDSFDLHQQLALDDEIHSLLADKLVAIPDRVPQPIVR